MWWKVWGNNEMDCIIVRADTSDEALGKGRKYNPKFCSIQPFDPSLDIERLHMELDTRR